MSDHHSHGWLAAGSYLVAFSPAGGLVVGGTVLVAVVRQRTAVDRRSTRPAS